MALPFYDEIVDGQVGLDDCTSLLLGLEGTESKSEVLSSLSTNDLASATFTTLNSFHNESDEIFTLDFDLVEGGGLDTFTGSNQVKQAAATTLQQHRSPSPMSMTASVSGSEPYSPNPSEEGEDADQTDLLEYLLQDSDIQITSDADEPQESKRPRRQSILSRSSTRGVDDRGGPWGKTKNRVNSKNAVAARENRQKKKMYIESLEELNKRLTEENSHLKKESGATRKKMSSMEEEIKYLQKVLYNQSALSGLLKNLNQSDVRLSTQFQVGESQPGTTLTSTGGVCLHVNGTDASLKFCHSCARPDQP